MYAKMHPLFNKMRAPPSQDLVHTPDYSSRLIKQRSSPRSEKINMKSNAGLYSLDTEEIYKVSFLGLISCIYIGVEDERRLFFLGRWF